MSLEQYKDAPRAELWEILQIQMQENQKLTAECDELAVRNKRQEDVICVLMNADETGYVDGEGFVVGFNQITDDAKDMLDKRDLESGAKHILAAVAKTKVVYGRNGYGDIMHKCSASDLEEYANQLTKQAEGE